ncbi:unnamed protein product [Clonostachys chloroleuca]|uniref:Uncharacterized protein n=1 Tax=Clonostachys chloroleuca TaxID=1926264 RepID=A0AA35MHL9_9HYPO|nr:unnamed protein product [Clonostachys chloroleuca]
MDIFTENMASITVGIIITIVIVSITTHHRFRFIITTDIFTAIDTSILPFIIISIIHDIVIIIIDNLYPGADRAAEKVFPA